MKIRANIKQLVNLLTWTTLGSVIAVSLAAPKAGSVTIKSTFIPDGDTSTLNGNFTGGAAPDNTVGGGNLLEIFEAAANWWESAIQDDFTLNIDYGWANLDDNKLGVAQGAPVTVTFPINPDDIFPLNNMTIKFDNDGSSEWFLDSTPNQNEEFEPVEEFTKNLGGGDINVGRVYTANNNSDAAGKFDLFTTALREIGHTLGFSQGKLKFTNPNSGEIIEITNPGFSNPIVIGDSLPFEGTAIQTTTNGGGHIEIPGESDPLSSPVLYKGLAPGQRKLPSELDILGVAQVSGFEKVNLNPAQNVPEPLTILGSVTALGLGILLKREHLRKHQTS